MADHFKGDIRGFWTWNDDDLADPSAELVVFGPEWEPIGFIDETNGKQLPDWLGGSE